MKLLNLIFRFLNLFTHFASGFGKNRYPGNSGLPAFLEEDYRPIQLGGRPRKNG